MALVVGYPDYIDEIIQKISVDLLVESFQKFYIKLVFYYNKDKQFKMVDFREFLEKEDKELVFMFDSLKLLSDNEFIESSKMDLNREFDSSVNFLKRENISNKLKKIETEIKLAEQKKESKKIEASKVKDIKVTKIGEIVNKSKGFKIIGREGVIKEISLKGVFKHF